jgi:hypothetical protein
MVLGVLAMPTAADAAIVTVGYPDVATAKPTGGGGCIGNCVRTSSQQTPSSPAEITVVPFEGSIIRWQLRGSKFDPVGTWRLRVLRPSGPDLIPVGTTPPVSLNEADGQPIPLAVPLKVQAGDRIGVTMLSMGTQGVGIASISGLDGGHQTIEANPAEGQPFVFTHSLDTTILLSATVESTTPAAPDLTAPTLTELTVAPTGFLAAKSGAALISAKVGTKVFYEISEAATVGLKIERGRPGVRSGKRCVRSKPRPKAKRCTRYSTLKGSLSDQGLAGLNSFRFTGRLANRALKRGKYRLRATATDAAGNRSKPRTAAFRILD